MTHRGWLSGIGGWAHATGMSHRDVVWAQLPLFHVAGLHFLFATWPPVAPMWSTGPAMRRGSGRWSGRGRSRSRPCFNAFDIVGHPDTGKSSHSIRLAFTQQTNDVLLQALPHATVATSYGATELGGMALVAFGDECARPGSVLGRPLVGMVVAVLDDNDQPVPQGQVGELCFRGASTTPGYWKLPEVSAEVSRDGWLHTGDLGREDYEGLIFFVDRKKDMVKPGGENVCSVEVEQALMAHPAVVECAVIGVPDDRWGEAVKAVVVARGKVTAEDLDRWCLDRLAAFKRPRWYDFVAGLPRNATAKVVKPELRAAHNPATSIRLPERS